MFNQNPFLTSFPGYGSLVKKAGFNWGSLLNNTQKTLGVINQAIPIFNQVKPIWNNAKTMFKVYGEFNNANKNTTNQANTNLTNSNNINNAYQPSSQGNEPNFFV